MLGKTYKGVIMARFQKNLIMAIIFTLFFLPGAGVQADSIPPFEVLSIRVEKDPNACLSTLFVTVRNNTQDTSGSGLFVHAAQFQELQQQGQRLSSSIGALRLDNLPAGHSREISFSFVRERAKTGVSFRFKVVADTVAYAEKLMECLAPGESAGFSRQMLPEAAQSIVKVDFIGDGTVLDTQSLGGAPSGKPKTIDKLAPEVKKQMRTIKPRN